MKRIIGRKAEWLKGDGEAWIETNVPLSQYYTIRAQYLDRNTDSKTSEFESVLLWTREFVDGLFKTIMFGSYETTRICYYTEGSNSTKGIVRLSYIPNSEYDTELATQYIKVNGISYSITQYNNVVMPINTFKLFYCFLESSKGPCGKSISLKRFEIVDKISLTPIQLTSSLPPYLASDNKPHSAGECGMWDSVSEKFFGNANTAGEFTVENLLDEYVEVDLTGIAINGKYQRVAVENTEIPSIVWNGVNARMLMLNGKVVWSNVLLKIERYELYEYLTASAGAFVTTDIQETENSEIYAEVVFDSSGQRTVVIRQGSELIPLISTETNNKVAPFLKSYRVSSGSYYYGFALSSSKSFTLGEVVRLVFSAKWNKDSHQIDVSESYMSANNEVLTLKYTQEQLNAVAKSAGYALINVGSIDIFSKQNVSNPKLSCYIQKNECELRPCRKVIRNVKDGTERYEIGIFDKVSKKFYGNSGDGELFVEGNIIETIVI